MGEGAEGGSFCLVRGEAAREGSERKFKGPPSGRFREGSGEATVSVHTESARAARLLEARSLSARPGLSTPTSLMSSAGLPEHSRDGMNGQQAACVKTIKGRMLTTTMKKKVTLLMMMLTRVGMRMVTDGGEDGDGGEDAGEDGDDDGDADDGARTYHADALR